MNANKIRGTEAERKVLRMFREYGYQGLRSPSSLSKIDLLISTIGTIQVKYHKRLAKFYEELYKFTKRTDIVIQCGDLWGTYLKTFLEDRPTADTRQIHLRNTYSLATLIEGQDYLVFASQYKPFMIFSTKLEKIIK